MAQNTNENAENTQVSQEELSELLKVRREKLEKLQSEGKDPFQIVKYPVDTHSNDILNDYENYEEKNASHTTVPEIRFRCSCMLIR